VKVAGVVLMGAVLVLVAALVAGAWRWRRASSSAVARLVASRRASVPNDTTDATDRLPAPVARYFRRVLPSGAPPVRGARLRQEGTFRTGEDEDSWRPFTATQVFNVAPPGFVWDARIRMAPGLAISVRDSYVGGAGRMHAQMLGWFTLVDMHGRAGIDAGALHRYLAEAMWLPGALRPGSGITWTAIDDSTARATLADGTTRVSLEFRFSADGDIAGVFAPDRLREVRGEFVPTPWDAQCLAWGERAGVRIPLEVEVAWTIDGTRRPYWRGRVTEAEYARAEPGAPVP